jgi:asparagine synthase (glutamine-hydrolysing)
MCGIAGFAGNGTREDGIRMIRAIDHRGPDEENFWINESPLIFLGHQRLSILDHKGGCQPMWSLDNRLCIIFNGEIYNHRQLRKELIQHGHDFRSDHSDTEVILYAYRQWGMEMLSRLNGMWAFVILDLDNKHLFLSRDRFGQKPLYYSFQNKTFAFSSELKSLIQHSLIPSNMSSLALIKYYAYGFIPAPYALYDKIYKLPAGNNLLVSYETLVHKKWSYWDYHIEPEYPSNNHPPKKQEIRWAEEINEKLQKAVQCRMPADVPLGFFLSGGIDSSAVVAMAMDSNPLNEIQTFSIGFCEQSFDESSFSTYMAKYLGTNHHHHKLSLEKARECLPQLIQKLDEPMGDASLLPTALLCQQTRKKVTVALGGDGADELFCGYDPFHAIKLFHLYKKLMPQVIHEGILLLSGLFPVSFNHMNLGFILRQSLTGLKYPQPLWNPIWLAPLSPEDLKDLFHEPFQLEDIYEEAIGYWENNSHLDLIDRTQIFYVKLYLQNSILTKIDRASMIHSLEVRSPFLDINLVNLARTIPWHFKYRHFQSKYILKKALHHRLPDKIIYRRKHGFGVPVGKWFFEQTLPWKDIHLNIMNPQVARLFEKKHCHLQNDYRLFLWCHWVLSRYLNGNTI